MQFELDPSSGTPLYRQLADQIHFAINTGTLKVGDKLPGLRRIAQENDLAVNTVAKALRQLEMNGLVIAHDRSGYRVAAPGTQQRYQARGVSSSKQEVHDSVDKLDRGLFPGAFCKITEDYLGGDPNRCNIIHADGSGTKSIIAYLKYRESGDLSPFYGIAQDSIVMNLDDLICAGARGRILISSTINRNAINCPGEVISALIDGTEAFIASMRDLGVDLHSGGGETADVGDLTGTVVVDTCAVTVMDKQDVISGDGIAPGLAIVGLSSTGQASYEDRENSGIGSNGLTSARHDLLCHDYARNYPETYDSSIDANLVYCGPYGLSDPLPDSRLTVGDALLSPTRTYAPLVYRIRRELPHAIRGLIHCSGGGQTKCMRFGTGPLRFVKNNLFPLPPVFSAIQHASGTLWREMYQVYNMGHRMEIYCLPDDVEDLVQLAADYDIAARVIGHTESTDATRSELRIESAGDRFDY